jgi:hypothetical protein
LNEAGASKPGSTPFTVTAYVALLPVLVVTISGWAPVPVLVGTWTLI